MAQMAVVFVVTCLPALPGVVGGLTGNLSYEPVPPPLRRPPGQHSYLYRMEKCSQRVRYAASSSHWGPDLGSRPQSSNPAHSRTLCSTAAPSWVPQSSTIAKPTCFGSSGPAVPSCAQATGTSGVHP